MPYDVTTPTGQVRLLINDTSSSPVFEDPEIAAFLTLEGDSVKLAAATALDTIADDEALTAKVISAEGLSTNGAAVAAVLHARAKTLREQAVAEDDTVFEIYGPTVVAPELTSWNGWTGVL